MFLLCRLSAGGDWEQQEPSCHSRGPETDIPHPHHSNYCDGEQMTGVAAPYSGLKALPPSGRRGVPGLQVEGLAKQGV